MIHVENKLCRLFILLDQYALCIVLNAWMKIELSRPKYISWGVDDDNKRMWSGRSKYYAIQS